MAARVLTAILAALLPQGAPAQEYGPDGAMARALAEAERMLRHGETAAAESWYRSAFLEGWLLTGDLHRAAGNPAAAESAYGQALVSALEVRRPLLALAELALEQGDPNGAVNHLRQLLLRGSGDGRARRLLARAFNAAGKPELAVQQLEDAVTRSPEDLESRFALATGYLRLERPEAAAALFDELARKRPISRTWVLVGGTYRDFGEHDRARAALERALRQDPEVPRAHYHLGLLELQRDGRAAVDAAIARFEQERRISPEDPVNALYLGMALVAARRFEEALVPLDFAARDELGRLDALLHRGQALLGLERPREAAAAFESAVLWTAGRPPEALDALRMESLHYQLAQALRRSGREEAAAPHFEAAERYSTASTERSRDRLTAYLNGREEAGRSAALGALGLGETAVSVLGPESRDRLLAAARTTMARAAFNLGVMATQARRFVRAAGHFEQAAAIDPDFPKVQRSAGVARFHAGHFERAATPLSKALERQPEDAALRRMLALAWLNAEAWDRAADLLADDPQRAEDRSLQYAYGLALVRSGRLADAQSVFDQLLERHADWPELNVLLGQAAAQEGDYAAAVRRLERAIELRADVAEARAALGSIHLRAGRLPEAAGALRGELALHPDDHPSRYVLATVLELDNQPQAAMAELDHVLDAAPDFANARYLRGKILLEQGVAEEAAAELQAAMELAPEDANIRYQLGQAWRRLGRSDQAEEQFAAFRALKERDAPEKRADQ